MSDYGVFILKTSDGYRVKFDAVNDETIFGVMTNSDVAKLQPNGPALCKFFDDAEFFTNEKGAMEHAFDLSTKAFFRGVELEYGIMTLDKWENMAYIDFET